MYNPHDYDGETWESRADEERERLQATEDEDDAHRAAFLALSEDEQEAIIEAECLGARIEMQLSRGFRLRRAA